MTLPTSITTQLTALQTAFDAAYPIETAEPLVYADIDNKAWTLISEIDGQVATVGALLDSFAAGNTALLSAAALVAAQQNGEDELDAYECRSYIGRFTANLELVEGYGKYFTSASPLRIVSTVHAVMNFMDPKQSGYIGVI
jgi:hypothetical protein